MGDAVGAGVAAEGEVNALGVASGQDVFLVEPEGFYGGFGEAGVSEKVSDGGYGGNVYGLAFSEDADAFLVHEVAVFEGVHAGTDGCFYGTGAVGVGHDGQAFFVGDVDHFRDVFVWQGIFGKTAVGGKVHDATKHDLDKIGMFLFCFQHEGMIFFHIFEGKADDTTVVTFFMDAEYGGAICDAIFRGELSGEDGCAVMVTAITQPGDSGVVVSLEIFSHYFFCFSGFHVLHGFFVVGGIHEYMHVIFIKHVVSS